VLSPPSLFAHPFLVPPSSGCRLQRLRERKPSGHSSLRPALLRALSLTPFTTKRATLNASLSVLHFFPKRFFSISNVSIIRESFFCQKKTDRIRNETIALQLTTASEKAVLIGCKPIPTQDNNIVIYPGCSVILHICLLPSRHLRSKRHTSRRRRSPYLVEGPRARSPFSPLPLSTPFPAIRDGLAWKVDQPVGRRLLHPRATRSIRDSLFSFYLSRFRSCSPSLSIILYLVLSLSLSLSLVSIAFSFHP